MTIRMRTQLPPLAPYAPPLVQDDAARLNPFRWDALTQLRHEQGRQAAIKDHERKQAEALRACLEAAP